MSKVSAIYSKKLLLEEGREPKNEIVFCWLKFTYEGEKKKKKMSKRKASSPRCSCFATTNKGRQDNLAGNNYPNKLHLIHF